MTSERSVGSCSHNYAVKILCGKGWLQAAQHPHERRGAQTFHINGKIGYSQELKSNCIWDFKWLKCVSIQSYINTISFRTSRHNPRKPDARALGRQRRSLRTPAPDTEPLGLYTRREGNLHCPCQTPRNCRSSASPAKSTGRILRSLCDFSRRGCMWHEYEWLINKLWFMKSTYCKHWSKVILCNQK